MSAIRVITFERDQDTSARSVLDIREFDGHTSPTPATWTELTKQNDRRLLIMDLMKQIDDLAAGRIDELSIVAHHG